MQPITDINVFLQEARNALEAYQEVSLQYKNAKAEKEKTEKQLHTEEEALNDAITSTIEARRKEIESTYDVELRKSNEELRKVNSRRDKARSQGVKDRINEETAELRAENRQLNSQIKTTLRQKGVPAFCSTGLFNALFFPSSFLDVLILILCFAICFFVIPYGVWKLFFAEYGTVSLVIIYVIDVLFFGGIFVAISRATVYRHHATLTEVRELRKQIRRNKKAIQDITQNIESDKDDVKYDLASYDHEIANIKQQLADTTMRKKDALSTFENVTSNIITDELSGNAKPKLDDLCAKLQAVSAQVEALGNERSAKALALSDNYETYLGRDLMTIPNIDTLISIAAHGTCTNLSEVIEEYNRTADE